VVGAGAAGLGLLAGCGRLPWQAPPPRVPRIGFLSGSSQELQLGAEPFLQGLHDYGYVEGQNLTIEWRFADGVFDRMPGLAADLVRLGPDAIVVPAAIDALVVSQATSTVPIVVGGSGGDLVQAQLAGSLAHPGGNVTGLSTPHVSLTGKRLQLLTGAVPNLSVLAVLDNPDVSTVTPENYEAFARTLGVRLLYLDVRAHEEFEQAFEVAASAQAGGLYTGSGPLFSRNRARIIALAAAHQLPAMFAWKGFVVDGGLMAYEHRLTDSYRRTAYYVDRILKGANPADLPVEQPMTFDFVVNLKTARELGITFPNEIMLQVTEVIQ
jgi:putative ABC transport system substrate-binding protein